MMTLSELVPVIESINTFKHIIIQNVKVLKCAIEIKTIMKYAGADQASNRKQGITIKERDQYFVIESKVAASEQVRNPREWCLIENASDIYPCHIYDEANKVLLIQAALLKQSLDKEELAFVMEAVAFEADRVENDINKGQDIY